METIFSEINSKIDPALKEEYKKYTGFDISDQMIERYLFLEGKASSTNLSEVLKRPIIELVGASENCIKIELRAIKFEY